MECLYTSPEMTPTLDDLPFSQSELKGLITIVAAVKYRTICFKTPLQRDIKMVSQELELVRTTLHGGRHAREYSRYNA